MLPLNGSGTVTMWGNNLTLQIESGYFNGVIAGAEGLEVGGGALTLAGANAYSGGTTLESGILGLGNAKALGMGNVAVLGGTLAVESGVAVLIGGNYTQSAGTTLQLNLDGVTPESSDGLRVADTAALAGSLQLGSGNGASFQAHGLENFDILSAGTTVSGTFAGLVQGVSASSVSLVYEPKEVLLELTGPTFQSLGLTTNQQAVGGALDGLNVNGGDPTLIGVMDTIVNGSLPGIYDQLSPSSLTPMFKMGFSTAQVEADMVGQHLAQMFGNGGFNSNNTAWNGEGPMFAGNMPAQEETQIAQSVQPERWEGFANGMGNFGTLTSDGNGAGYQFSTGGTTAGVDYRFGKDLVAGLMLGYDQSGTSQSTGTVNVSGGQIGLYAGWKQDALHIAALVDGGLDSYTTQRATLGGTASGSTSGQEFTGQLNVGYDLKMDDAKLTPFVSGQLTQVNVNGFTETGSLAPLTYGNQGEAYLSSDLGAQISRSWTVSGIKLSPQLSAAWEHVYQGNEDSLTANFGTGSSFTVSGPATGTDAAVLGGGLNAEFVKGFNVYAEYQGKLGMTNYTEQNISGGVNIGF